MTGHTRERRDIGAFAASLTRYADRDFIMLSVTVTGASTTHQALPAGTCSRLFVT